MTFKRTKAAGPQSDRPGRPANLSATMMGPRSVASARQRANDREQQQLEEEELDSTFGFARLTDGPPRTAFMFNMRQSSLRDVDSGRLQSCLDMYFVQEDGETFRAAHIFQPYFLIYVKEEGGSGKGEQSRYNEVETYLRYKYPEEIVNCTKFERDDLSVPNHLAGHRRLFMKLSFRNVEDLVNVRRQLLPTIEKNRIMEQKTEEAGMAGSAAGSRGSSHAIGMDADMATGPSGGLHRPARKQRDECLSYIVDIREYDVLYVQRVAIDTGYRVGLWYDVVPENGTGSCTLRPRPDILDRPLLKKMAFDIETTKAPLKFPNPESDNIMMISYMLDGDGYLIVNREIVSEDIADFDYTPKPEYEGKFTIFNVADEAALLEQWLNHIAEEKPLLYVTYNGDFFDWPFIARRCAILGIDLRKRIGIWEQGGEYMGRFSVHLDAFAWVKRDSYLPQGSQGLKAVTKVKLKYEPVELDPEDMLPFARDRPQELAAYSVSDAVATYYLYMKFVHLFIFSLCTIIPMPPSDVLRKGSGTLCELLLMVQAFEAGIVAPNKEKTEPLRFHKGHLLESETYIGGHVECLESGVFRSDLPAKFKIVPRRIRELQSKLDKTLQFAIEIEGGKKMEDIDMNSYREVRDTIHAKLQSLHDHPTIEVHPLIYHLDVGAMYPNIILTNRLQPMAIVDSSICSRCDFNTPHKRCQRKMHWSWRGRYYPATHIEYQTIRAQLEVEPLKHDAESMALRYRPTSFNELPIDQQAKRTIARVKAYSNKVYKGFAKEDVEEKEAVICQRENPFYVDTVRAFRDRRYEYKRLGKKAKQDVDAAQNEIEKVKANDRLLLFDSLQLAHKCILNSFYGYVMRKGARWQSIEMAGVVTQTGANLIKDARALVEEIGRPLELDTDGIWCILPSTFPENFKVKLKDGKGSVPISYPCSMLNIGVHENYTNDQYQTKNTTRPGEYEIHSECSIFFEVDGPYRAMVLPAAREEGKNIKKRYAVFNHDGSLAELKGFEIKRRGELKLIKIFQGQVFQKFLDGQTLEECYASVGAAANHWLDVCQNQGQDLEDEDVFELISENKNMSEALSTYGDAKSTSIQTARRLGEFLGEEMVRDKGLNCRFIITKKPLGAPTSERAVPVAIFHAEPAVKKTFLRRWLKDSSLSDFDVRSLIDWDYYIGRLQNAIQKIITIPAAFQKVANPVPRVAHPDWLMKKVKERDDTHKQTKLSSFFSGAGDMEDFGSSQGNSQFTNPLKPKFATVKRRLNNKIPAAAAATVELMEDDEEKEEEKQNHANSGKKRKTKTSEQSGVAAGSGLLAHEGDPLNDSSSSTDSLSPGGAKKRTSNIISLDNGDEEEDGTRGVAPAEEDAMDSSEDGPSTLFDKATDLSSLPAEQLSPSKPRRSRAPVPGSGSSARSSLAARLDLAAAELVPTPAPADDEPSEENLREYVNYHQQQWAKLRAKRRAEREKEKERQKTASAAGRDGHGPSRESLKLGRDGLAGFVRKQAASIRMSYWQIVQLHEDDAQPGLFHVWVFLDSGALQRMSVHVPRVLYVNSRRELPDNGKRIQRLLPRGRPCLNLYEISMPESDYIAHEKEFHSSINNRSEIEGVYETQVPLDFKLIMEVGCVCKLDTRAIKDHTPTEYQLNHLVYKTTAECPYLTPAHVSFRRIYLYHSFSDSRGLFGLFIEGQKEVTTIAVNPYSGALESINLKKMLVSCIQAAREAGVHMQQDGSEEPTIIHSTIATPPDTSTFAPLITVTDFDTAYSRINRILAEYKTLNSAPTLILAQVGGLSTASLYANLPILKTEFPVIQLSPKLDDNIYPALSWYSTAAKRMIQRYVAHPQWWLDQLHFCRYAHVPIGNMESDYPAFIADLFYARALRHAGHLLWMSKGPRPDLGGVEEDENYFADEHINLETSNPGLYRKPCMEIEIGQLAVNAVVQQALIEEMEGGSSLAVAASASASKTSDDSLLFRSFEGSGACRDAFRILKGCVGNWLADTVQNHNTDADLLLCHFYRWLRSPSSKLYDGALHRFVHQLMKKIQSMLLGRFDRLGAPIIYSNQNRLILATNKPSIPHALAAVKFMLDTIKQKPLFRMLTLEPARLWETLAWMDAANYGGILADTGADDDDDESGGSKTTIKLSDGRTIQLDILSHWNVADYLPREIQDWFLVSVAQFLIQPYRLSLEFVEENKRRQLAAASEGGEFSASQVMARIGVSLEEEEQQLRVRVAELIESDFARELFAHVERIKHMDALRGNERVGTDTQSIEFPVLAGCHLPLHNPALEFVKTLCAVMSLDQQLGDSVRKVREALMKLVGVKAFSPQAQFANPCLTFVLPDVICSYCNQCRDLDLCRDPDLVVHHWRCNICDQPYDLGVIEAMLVEFVIQRSVAYQVQDLKCAACGKVKVTNMAKYCPCSGQYINTTSQREFDRLMRTFSNIGVYHQFNWLLETINFIRERGPEITEFDDPVDESQDAAAAMEKTSELGTSADAQIEID